VSYHSSCLLANSIPLYFFSQAVHYFAEGHCEQGMRGSFVVSGIASSSISPEFTAPYDTPGQISTRALLPKPQAAGAAVGLSGAVLALGAVARAIYRKKRAQRNTV